MDRDAYINRPTVQIDKITFWFVVALVYLGALRAFITFPWYMWILLFPVYGFCSLAAHILSLEISTTFLRELECVFWYIVLAISFGLIQKYYLEISWVIWVLIPCFVSAAQLTSAGIRTLYKKMNKKGSDF